ncbi:MAG: UDP-N-acetylmuramate--alanine ligase [Candidatus Omnitrophota bacterium]|jgi:UDP-N-acetylmuramate--alanine ligase
MKHLIRHGVGIWRNKFMSKHYFFIGIGGIGMGAIASLLLDKGARVSGSDLRDGRMVQQLRDKGAKISIGHDAGNVCDVDVVIYSSAIKEDNPEYAFAKQNNFTLYQRAQMLAELMEDQFSITVAGAHGKTTTTSMVAHLLTEAKVHPTCVVGGMLTGMNQNAQLGGGRYFIAEVDESDGSFLHFKPKLSLITNIDLEHLDHYNGWEDIENIYTEFIGNTQVNGQLLICGDDKRLKRLVDESQKIYQTYGLGEGNDLRAENIRQNGLSMTFNCIYRADDLGELTINVPGEHNVLNALACILCGLTLYIDFNMIVPALSIYGGVDRRFQKKADVNDILVIDDYAHHPTEVKKTLQAARGLGANKRVVAVFQPHRYSRLAYLEDDFCTALTNCDHLFITDIYAASEKPMAEVSVEKFIKKLNACGITSVEYKAMQDLVSALEGFVQPNDVVMILGAGDITRISDELSEVLVTKYKK